MILKNDNLLLQLQELAKPQNIKTVFANQKDRDLFYWSTAWRKMSKRILKRDHYECQVCKSQGRVTIDKLIVHHIQPLEYHPELKLTESNLMTVCHACHNTIHRPIKQKRWDDEWW